MSTTIRHLIDQMPLPDGAEEEFSPYADTDRLRLVWFLLTHCPAGNDNVTLDSDSTAAAPAFPLQPGEAFIDVNGDDAPYAEMPSNRAQMEDLDGQGTVYEALLEWTDTDLLRGFSYTLVRETADESSVEVGVSLDEGIATYLLQWRDDSGSTYSRSARGSLAALGYGLCAYDAWESMSSLAARLTATNTQEGAA